MYSWLAIPLSVCVKNQEVLTKEHTRTHHDYTSEPKSSEHVWPRMYLCSCRTVYTEKKKEKKKKSKTVHQFHAPVTQGKQNRLTCAVEFLADLTAQGSTTIQCVLRSNQHTRRRQV